MHVFDKIPLGLASLFEIKVSNSKDSCVRKFRNFTVVFMAKPMVTGVWCSYSRNSTDYYLLTKTSGIFADLFTFLRSLEDLFGSQRMLEILR